MDYEFRCFPTENKIQVIFAMCEKQHEGSALFRIVQPRFSERNISGEGIAMRIKVSNKNSMVAQLLKRELLL